MSDKPQRKATAFQKPPRERATIDHFYGKDQHVADGCSTDPATLDVQQHVGGQTRTPADRPHGKKDVVI